MHIISPNPSLHLMKKPCCQTAVSPTSRKVHCCKKDLTIGAICKHIFHHGVTIISTVKRILLHEFASAFRQKRNTVHKTYDIINKQLSCLYHVSVLPHLCIVGELYHCKQMIIQEPDHPLWHTIYPLAANGRGEPQNKTEMLIMHHASQIKKENTKIPIRA